MQGLLEFSLFFTLLTTGACLECEICSGKGNHCTGPVKTCPQGKNVCMTAYTESTLDGKPEQTIEKECVHADLCTSPNTELYFGPGRTMRTAVYCCVKDSCQKSESTLPMFDTRINGKQCPACHAWSETCKEEIVNCTGHNTYCFDVASHSHAEMSSLDRTMKGCTSMSVCSSITTGHSVILGSADVIRRASCTPEASRCSRCSGLLLPVFSGLLLLLHNPA